MSVFAGLAAALEFGSQAMMLNYRQGLLTKAQKERDAWLDAQQTKRMRLASELRTEEYKAETPLVAEREKLLGKTRSDQAIAQMQAEVDAGLRLPEDKKFKNQVRLLNIGAANQRKLADYRIKAEEDAERRAIAEGRRLTPERRIELETEASQAMSRFNNITVPLEQAEKDLRRLESQKIDDQKNILNWTYKHKTLPEAQRKLAQDATNRLAQFQNIYLKRDAMGQSVPLSWKGSPYEPGDRGFRPALKEAGNEHIKSLYTPTQLKTLEDMGFFQTAHPYAMSLIEIETQQAQQQAAEQRGNRTREDALGMRGTVAPQGAMTGYNPQAEQEYNLEQQQIEGILQRNPSLPKTADVRDFIAEAVSKGYSERMIVETLKRTEVNR